MQKKEHFLHEVKRWLIISSPAIICWFVITEFSLKPISYNIFVVLLYGFIYLFLSKVMLQFTSNLKHRHHGFDEEKLKSILNDCNEIEKRYLANMFIEKEKTQLLGKNIIESSMKIALAIVVASCCYMLQFS